MATVLVLVPILINPKWNTYADFINPQLTAALRLDAKLSLHPIKVVVRRFLMQVRSDRFLTHCHTLKLLLVRQPVCISQLENATDRH